MSAPELEEIPVGVRLKYLLLSTPSTLKYFTRCLIGIVKGKPIYKILYIGLPFTIPIRHRVKYFKVEGVLNSKYFNLTPTGISSNSGALNLVSSHKIINFVIF